MSHISKTDSHAQRFITITQEEIIPAPPEKVYEAFINPEIHSAFTGSEVKGIARIDGDFSAWDGYITGRFIDLEKGKRIVQRWKTSEWPEGYPPSVLEFTFTKVDKGTLVKLLHTHVPQDQAESYRQGWAKFYWQPLKEYFSNKKKIKKS